MTATHKRRRKPRADKTGDGNDPKPQRLSTTLYLRGRTHAAHLENALCRNELAEVGIETFSGIVPDVYFADDCTSCSGYIFRPLPNQKSLDNAYVLFGPTELCISCSRLQAPGSAAALGKLKRRGKLVPKRSKPVYGSNMPPQCKATDRKGNRCVLDEMTHTEHKAITGKSAYAWGLSVWK